MSTGYARPLQRGTTNLEKAKLVGSLVRPYDDSLDVPHIHIPAGDGERCESQSASATAGRAAVGQGGTHRSELFWISLNSCGAEEGRSACGQPCDPAPGPQAWAAERLTTLTFVMRMMDWSAIAVGLVERQLRLLASAERAPSWECELGGSGGWQGS